MHRSIHNHSLQQGLLSGDPRLIAFVIDSLFVDQLFRGMRKPVYCNTPLPPPPGKQNKDHEQSLFRTRSPHIRFKYEYRIKTRPCLFVNTQSGEDHLTADPLPPPPGKQNKDHEQSLFRTRSPHIRFKYEYRIKTRVF